MKVETSVVLQVVLNSMEGTDQRGPHGSSLVCLVSGDVTVGEGNGEVSIDDVFAKTEDGSRQIRLTMSQERSCWSALLARYNELQEAKEMPANDSEIEEALDAEQSEAEVKEESEIAEEQEARPGAEAPSKPSQD